MKTTKLFLAIAVFALTATSCVEKSEKYKALLSQKDSIEVQYNNTLDILNEVEAGFQSIRSMEMPVLVEMNNIEGKSLTKKQQLATQINDIKEILNQNKAKIDELQAQLEKGGKQNATLSKMIKRMEAELTEKSAMIETLQADLASKNLKIEELSGKVVNLESSVTALNATSANQQATIEAQDTDLNTVWYTVGTSKELKEKNILVSNGLFKPKSLMNKEFDQSTFAQSDKRNLKTIETGSKKPKLLTTHPEGSYNMVAGEDKMITIEILDPVKFWQVSKYLVIQR